MFKLLIKTAVHIPCHKFSYHTRKNTASSLHSLPKWVVLGLNSGFLKNAAPRWPQPRNQCILEQTKVSGPPTNFHIVDFMSSVSSTIVSAPTGGRCLVVVEKLLPLSYSRDSSPCTMSLFENWCHFNLQLHICSPHVNELIKLGSNKSIYYWIESRIKLDKIHQHSISWHTISANYSLNIWLSKFFGSRLHTLSINKTKWCPFLHCPPMIERGNPLESSDQGLLKGCLSLSDFPQ